MAANVSPEMTLNEFVTWLEEHGTFLTVPYSRGEAQVWMANEQPIPSEIQQLLAYYSCHHLGYAFANASTNTTILPQSLAASSRLN